jgi:hypothetical protein
MNQDERSKIFENLFVKSQEHVHKLNSELRNKDVENERLINDLKQTKMHIALLEETTAHREF